MTDTEIRRAVREREGGKCVRCGGHAQTTQHRVHGNRADMRASNLLAVCGDGTTGCHGWMEAHRREAREVWGWEVTTAKPESTTTRAVYVKAGILGEGWYRLDDEFGITLVEAV